MPLQPDRRLGPPRGLARYEDDEFNVEPFGEGRAPPSLVGMYGFIVAMVALGLVAVVIVLSILLNQENQARDNPDRTRWMLYWFMFLDLVCFIGSVIAIVMGIRGLAPANVLYRGFSVAALVLGILELITTSFSGVGLFCCTMIFELQRGGMG